MLNPAAAEHPDTCGLSLVRPKPCLDWAYRDSPCRHGRHVCNWDGEMRVASLIAGLVLSEVGAIGLFRPSELLSSSFGDAARRYVAAIIGFLGPVIIRFPEESLRCRPAC